MPTFVAKVVSLLFNTLSGFVISFLPRNTTPQSPHSRLAPRLLRTGALEACRAGTRPGGSKELRRPESQQVLPLARFPGHRCRPGLVCLSLSSRHPAASEDRGVLVTLQRTRPGPGSWDPSRQPSSLLSVSGRPGKLGPLAPTLQPSVCFWKARGHKGARAPQEQRG